MDYNANYERFVQCATDDPVLRVQLVDMTDDEKREAFTLDMVFGTAGIRGILGPGTNRMNIYTVGQAVEGLARYLREQSDSPSVAIAYDSRINSELFSQRAASVLAASGIKVHLFPCLTATPILSYAIRALSCTSGIVVTASHNPSMYNGCKFYGDDGCQMTPAVADRVLAHIKTIDMFTDVHAAPFADALADGRIVYVPESLVDDFLREVKAQSVHPEAIREAGLKAVYTPLNGTGLAPVCRVLEELGLAVTVVPEQRDPDGNFTTCPYPNPEAREAMQLGLQLADKTDADILIATDPDADRMGCAVRHGGDMVLLTGNEMGSLMLHYIAGERKALGTLPDRPLTVKTIVTTKLIDAIGRDLGVEVVDVLTGFKNIGEQVLLLEKKGEEQRYIFGFEESYGFNAGTFCRDKDAVFAAMMIAELAAFYKRKNMTLVDAVDALYRQYGYYKERQISFTYEGLSGMQTMGDIMRRLRDNRPDRIAGRAVVTCKDYLARRGWTLKDGAVTDEFPVAIPQSDVLEYIFEGGASLIVRPSGTEPKIKLYLFAQATDESAALRVLDELQADGEALVR